MFTKAVRFTAPVVMSAFARSTMTRSDGEKIIDEIIDGDKIDVDDEEWEKKKSECSFCRMFLESPCKAQFKLWSKCVDKAKSEDVDFKDVCSVVSKGLFQCTSDNQEYFQALNEAMGGDEDEDVESESNEGSDTEESVDMNKEQNAVVFDVVASDKKVDEL
jgi:hypothetical protein